MPWFKSRRVVRRSPPVSVRLVRRARESAIPDLRNYFKGPVKRGAIRRALRRARQGAGEWKRVRARVLTAKELSVQVVNLEKRYPSLAGKDRGILMAMVRVVGRTSVLPEFADLLNSLSSSRQPLLPVRELFSHAQVRPIWDVLDIAGGARVAEVLRIAGGAQVGAALRITSSGFFGAALNSAGGQFFGSALKVAGGRRVGLALERDFREAIKKINLQRYDEL